MDIQSGTPNVRRPLTGGQHQGSRSGQDRKALRLGTQDQRVPDAASDGKTIRGSGNLDDHLRRQVLDVSVITTGGVEETKRGSTIVTDPYSSFYYFSKFDGSPLTQATPLPLSCFLSKFISSLLKLNENTSKFCFILSGLVLFGITGIFC